ncbi:MAG: transcription antitermination factor NusB [Rubrivivax sp.]|nr:transcription antitermination factor NusB [Rubrivivax sp.]
MPAPPAPPASATPPAAPEAPAASAAPAAPAAKKPPHRSARRRAREFALQGLYQWLLSTEPVPSVIEHLAQFDDFAKADRVLFDTLMHGTVEQAAALHVVIARHGDRKTSLLSPVEHAALMIGCYELKNCPEVPYRVIINEAVELTKSFGGTDGHKYVNGVLDRCAAELRPGEARPAAVRRVADT